MTEKGFETAHLDELESLPVDDEGLVWRPVRRRFGIESFGVNAYTATEAGQRVVEEHTEARNDHEELYYVAAGRAVFTLDDEEIDAPAGTFVYVRPATRRGALAQEDGTTVLALGGRPGGPFEISTWEAYFAAFAYRKQGEVEKGRGALEEALERRPDSWELLYNAACYEALAGRGEAALGYLSRAVELSPEARELARSDEDFDTLRDDPVFEVLVAEPSKPNPFSEEDAS